MEKWTEGVSTTGNCCRLVTLTFFGNWWWKYICHLDNKPKHLRHRYFIDQSKAIASLIVVVGVVGFSLRPKSVGRSGDSAILSGFLGSGSVYHSNTYIYIYVYKEQPWRYMYLCILHFMHSIISWSCLMYLLYLWWLDPTMEYPWWRYKLCCTMILNCFGERIVPSDDRVIITMILLGRKRVLLDPWMFHQDMTHILVHLSLHRSGSAARPAAARPDCSKDITLASPHGMPETEKDANSTIWMVFHACWQPAHQQVD